MTNDTASDLATPSNSERLIQLPSLSSVEEEDFTHPDTSIVANNVAGK